VGLIIRQPHMVAAQLRLQHSILFTEYVDPIALLRARASQPAREDQRRRGHDDNLPDSDVV